MREYARQHQLIKVTLSVLLVATIAAVSTEAQQPTPAYVALGDSIEFGLGDDIAADGMGYVEPSECSWRPYWHSPWRLRISASRSRARLTFEDASHATRCTYRSGATRDRHTGRPSRLSLRPTP